MRLKFQGRQAKAERAVLKKKRALIVGKGCLNEEATTTLLSFVTKSQKEHLETLVFLLIFFLHNMVLVINSNYFFFFLQGSSRLSVRYSNCCSTT